MRILVYISTIDMNSDVYMGVAKKIKMQCEAFEKLGFQVKNLSNSVNNPIEKLKKVFPSYYATSYRVIKKRICSINKIDVCYIRYQGASRGLVDVLKTVRNYHPDCKIILEMPTYPYEQELKSLLDKPLYFRDVLYRGKLKNYVNLITTFSDFKEIYGIPVIEITNGIDLDVIKPRKAKEFNPDSLVIIGVAGMQIWHGFDRIIEGLSLYYKKEVEKPRITFIGIGEGPYKEKWIQLAENHGVSEYVKFLGAKSGDELEKLYNDADLGIGSLGIYHVMDFQRVSILKTREYCAKGLPFITTQKDYMFSNDRFKYSLVVKDNNSAIDMYEVVEFLNNINKERNECVISDMRDYATNNIQWCEILKPLVE
ncbi:Glycosyltransferase involved in cell wall bisynthesis [Butyrivibrio sp. Su6]|uniref:glycosyltransferase n=1 Tax=Butyrivibrio sp. Su6 TaxID=1520810 RepID=UPI00089ED3A7|nr:glycosyltransferase [Butyrivibrio sp. Su6]SEG16755.1 Glycosyltransferase involved in cell wall bisynthesis [Butyrivibrio sp. Su6]